MFKALRTPRRIILSGTPIQNDLGEFHTMVCKERPSVSHPPIATNVIDFCTGRLLQSGLTWYAAEQPSVSVLKFWSDDYATFRRIYEVPILKSRVPGCSSKEAEIGETRSSQVGPNRASPVANLCLICTSCSCFRLEKALSLGETRPS
jgi:DNA repair and recombination protein RAD54B